MADGLPLHRRLRVVRGGEVLWISAPQAEWITDGTGRLLVDLLRFERLEQDWRSLAAKIGAQPDLGHVNASERGSTDHYYDAATRALVRERYAVDFDLLGYDAG